MAQLNSSVVQGSLRVTDTTYTTDLNLASATASQFVKTDANKSLVTVTLSKSDVGLNNVTNDAQVKASLGTTKGDMLYWSANATPARLAIGTAGYTLQATANGPAWTQTVAVANGGTGKTSWTQWGVLYASADTTLANTTAGTAGYLLQGNGSAAPSWIQATNNNTASTIVKRDSSGNFSAGTITATVTNATTTEDTTNSLYIVGVTSAASTTLKRDTYAILKKAELTLGAANNAGSIKLFSSGANSKAHIIQGQSATSDDFAHTLPNSNGWVATGASSGVGDDSTPIYLGDNGILSAVSSVSSSLVPKNDYLILTDESDTNSVNRPTIARATIPSNYALNKKIYYSSNQPTGDNAIQGMFWFKPADVTIEDLKCLPLHILAAQGSSAQTFDNPNITKDMVVIKCDVLTPSAQSGDVTWTTSNGHISLAGTFSTSTYIDLYLMRANQEDQ